MQRDFLKEDKKLLMALKKRTIPIGKQTQWKRCPLNLAKRLEILSPKQMLKKLAFEQVKAGNLPENLLNEII